MFSVKLDQLSNTLTISYGGIVSQDETRGKVVVTIDGAVEGN